MVAEPNPQNGPKPEGAAIASAASFDLIIPSYLKYVFIVLSIFKLILLFCHILKCFTYILEL
jgi:hypothetical protein